MKENDRSVPITFRIYADSLQILKEHADREDLSSNTLLNRILKRWISFELSIQPTNPIILPSSLFCSMLDTISDEDLATKKQQLIPDLAKSLFALVYDTSRVEEFLRHLEFMSKYSGWFSLQVFKNNRIGDTAKLIFKHNHGAKWSAFLEEYLLHIVKTYYRALPISIEANDEYVLFTIRTTEQMSLSKISFGSNYNHSG